MFNSALCAPTLCRATFSLALNERENTPSCSVVFVFIVKITASPASPLRMSGGSGEAARGGNQGRNFASDLGNISSDHPSKLKSSYE